MLAHHETPDAVHETPDAAHETLGGVSETPDAERDRQSGVVGSMQGGVVHNKALYSHHR